MTALPDNETLHHHARLMIEQRLVYKEIVDLAKRLMNVYPVPLEDRCRLAAFVQMAHDVASKLEDNKQKGDLEISG